MITMPDGDVVILDLDAGSGSHDRVRRFTSGGTIAGTFDVLGDTGDDGPGIDALLSSPSAIAEWRGHVLIADLDNDAIRCVW
jgi:hypothetical protein